MAVKFEVQPLFATPLFRADIGDTITEAEREVLRGLEMNTNQTNLISRNLYIFDLPELQGLARTVHGALNTFARDVMGIDQTLYVTQSWSLVNGPGEGMHTHSHSNSIVSGSLYYDDLPEPGADVVFSRYTAHRTLQLDPAPERANYYNASTHTVSPASGELLLFASELSHMVQPNRSDRPRRAVAFNSFVQGVFGNHRDVSELSIGKVPLPAG